MNNLFNSKEYKETREHIERYFIEENLIKTKKIILEDNYTLEISEYNTKKGYFNVTRGIIKNGDEIIADIKRNYSAFPYYFVKHKNGKLYLLCGEDYQGYTIVNITDKTTQTFIPEEWKNGVGFCWIEMDDYDEDDNQLRVEGCIWGWPYEVIKYDFSNPDVIPLPILERYDLDD